MILPELVFILALGLLTLYPIVGLLDLNVSEAYMKKHHWYPMSKFQCFCGYKRDMWSGNGVIPTRGYHTYKVRQHMKGCLLWILNADFNGLTPYWGNSYAEDIAKGLDADRVLGKGWQLQRHQKYSDRARAGKDPFGEDD